MAQHFLKVRNWIFLSIAVTLALITVSAEKVFKASALKQKALFTAEGGTVLKTEILNPKDSLIVSLQGEEHAAAVFKWTHLRKGPVSECYQEGYRAIGMMGLSDIYVDTAKSAAYAIIHKRCKDYYLFRLYKSGDEYICRTDYILTHDRYASLQDSTVIRNGIVFYPFQYEPLSSDSIRVRKKLNGYEVILPLIVKDSIHYVFPEKNNMPGIYNRIAKAIQAQTRRPFTPEDVHYIYNFFHRNSYFEDILFSKDAKQGVGFLHGNVVGQIRCNPDTIPDLIIYIDGTRWVNAKILCYDPVNGVILWKRELAVNALTSDFLITDIDGDRREEIIFSTYSPVMAFDLNYYAYPDSFGMPSKSYFRIWNNDGTDKYINKKKCEWVNAQEFTRFKYVYIPEENSFLLGVSSHIYNPHFLMKLDLKTNTLDTLDIPTNSVTFINKSGDRVVVLNLNKNPDEGNVVQTYVLSPKGAIINVYEKTFSFVFSPIRENMISLLGGIYFASNEGLYNEKLEKVMNLQPNTGIIGILGNTLILSARDYSLPERQQYIYQAPVYESYTFERWFLYLLMAELIVLFFYYVIRYILFQPINTGTNSYFELYSVFGKMYFWILQGNMGKIYKIPNRLSYSKETFLKLLDDLGGKSEPLLIRRFFGTRYEVYEIPSKDEWIIIQRIAHDMKNRMLSLGLRIEALQDCLPDCPKAKERNNLEALKSDITGISETASRLSRFSHLERLQAEPVDLDEFFKQWLNHYLNHPKFHVIQRQIEVNGAKTRLDIKLFEMALSNILDNALETVKNSETVTIHTARNDGVLIIQISNPAEIEPACLEHLWEPGYSTKKNGTGLGIPIAKQIIGKHAGEMDIEYKEGIFSVMIKVKLLEEV